MCAELATHMKALEVAPETQSKVIQVVKSLSKIFSIKDVQP